MSLGIPSPIVGKAVGVRLYLHTSAIEDAPAESRDALQRAITIAGISNDAFNVVRFDSASGTFGLLDYPDFFNDPFPSLARSWKVDLAAGLVSYRTHIQSQNPPILHRKELLPPWRARLGLGGPRGHLLGGPSSAV